MFRFPLICVKTSSLLQLFLLVLLTYELSTLY